jgi:5-methyltetrahydrofolate--homocysteine methyltransferase
MIIIGELINGTRKAVAAAIEQRDAEFIKNLASREAEACAAFIDCNAGTVADREPEDMVWLVERVQEVTSLPIAVDTPNARAVTAGLDAYAGSVTPMVNSVTLERDRVENILPIAAERKTNLVCLAMDDRGVPSLPGQREENAKRLIDTCVAAGLPPGNLYLDPVVTMQAHDQNSGPLILNAIAAIHEFAPEVHLTAGLSNISFGLPNRKLLNRVFLALCLGRGLDSAILDPTDEQLMAVAVAAEALLGRDEWCMNYITAGRAGKLPE